MAGKPQYAWPPDEEVSALVEKYGQQGAADRLGGITRSGLQQRIRDRGLSSKRVPQTVDSKPVDDPERIKATQREAEVQHLKAQLKQHEKALASQEEFFERIVEATKLPARALKFKVAKQDPKKPARSVITPIFDQQYGQFVRPLDTPGNRGAYSTAVFDQRLTRWVEGVTGIMAREAEGYRLEELIIPFGGDHVEGDEIFAGQAWQLEADPCKQVWDLATKMDQAVREVVRFAREEIGVKFIACYGVDDNHGKVGGKKAGARPSTYSWNWLFLKLLFDLHLREVPIDQTAIEPGGALFFKCAGHEFQLIHGHQIRGWGGLPFYGLTKHDGRSIRLHNRLYRYLLMGHHHQAAEVPNGAGETIISGDWVGPNNLSGLITAASRPQQKALFVSAKWGLAGTERIYFQDAIDAYESTPVYGQEAA